MTYEFDIWDAEEKPELVATLANLGTGAGPLRPVRATALSTLTVSGVDDEATVEAVRRAYAADINEARRLAGGGDDPPAVPGGPGPLPGQ